MIYLELVQNWSNGLADKRNEPREFKVRCCEDSSSDYPGFHLSPTRAVFFYTAAVPEILIVESASRSQGERRGGSY
jgi:hypothetical protein